MNKKAKHYVKNILVVLALIFIYPVGLYLMFKKTSWSKNTKMIVTIIASIFAIMVIATLVNKPQADNNRGTIITVAPPKFDTYLNMPMADVATELKPYLYEYNFATKSDEPTPRDYDPSYSHQIYAKKDGYKLFFENGASSANSKYGTPEGTYDGTANIISIELAQMGKCSFSQVYNKIDEAMTLTGLNPAAKGTRDDSMGSTQHGYGAYNKYLGKDSLEIALICDYEGANYKLQLRVLPQYR